VFEEGKADCFQRITFLQIRKKKKNICAAPGKDTRRTEQIERKHPLLITTFENIFSSAEEI